MPTDSSVPPPAYCGIGRRRRHRSAGGTSAASFTKAAIPIGRACLLCTIFLTAAPALAAGPFYVSTTGSDANNGTSYSTPFLTLEAAQAAMQATGGGTTYLEGGTYALTKPISLANSDTHETWTAYPGQVPVLDGGNATSYAFFVDVFNAYITISDLRIQNFTNSGISALYTSYLTISFNTIYNITSPDWRSGVAGASVLFENVQSSTISENDIDKNTYAGIAVEAGGTGDSISGNVIGSNYVKNVCNLVNDCGSIYVLDATQQSTDVKIERNSINGFGTTTSGGKGIYMDNGASNVTVVNNNIYGTGDYCFENHGGFSNVVRLNICDMTSMARLGLYQNYANAPNGGMAGNIFEDNIVYDTTTPPATVWDYINENGASFALPADETNLYWDTDGTLPNTPTQQEPIYDTNPDIANPLFVAAPNHNYKLHSNSPALSMGFTTNQ